MVKKGIKTNKIVLVRNNGKQIVVNGDGFTFKNGAVNVYVENPAYATVFSGMGFTEVYKYDALCHNNDAPSHHIRDLFLRLTQAEFEEMYGKSLDAYFTANCGKCCH